MSTGGGSPANGPIDLRKERPDETLQGPAWIVLPARVIALVVIVPLRLVHDLAVQVARGVRTVWGAMMRAPRGFGRVLYRWLLAPIGRLVAAVARGVGALLGLLVVRPVRWLAAVVIFGFARWLGRGAVRLGRWIHGAVLAPIGAFFVVLGRGLAWLGEHALLRPLRALGRGLAWLGAHALLRPLRALGRGLAWVVGFLGRGFALLLKALVVVPATFVWRYVLVPLLRGLAWMGGGALSALAAFMRVLAAGWHAFAGAAAWTWNLVGRFLAWVARMLLVLPAKAVWRYVLAPTVAGLVAVWRLAGRFLRWFWRTLVAGPVRVLVVGPARWAWTSVLRPAGRGAREAWRTSVRDPLRAARRTIRETSRDVRLQLRRTFRGD